MIDTKELAVNEFEDVVDWLNDPERALGAVGDAAEEILRIRGLMCNLIDHFNWGSGRELFEVAIEQAKLYMRGE